MARSRTQAPAALPTEVLGRVVLVAGKEEFLNERTVASVRGQVVKSDPEAELAETRGAQLTLATLGELSAPSLFSSTRCVVVHGLEELPDESVAAMVDYASAPSEDVALVLVHNGGQKGSGTLTKLRKLPAVVDIRNEPIKVGDLPGFTTAEVRREGGTIEPDAVRALVDAVGQDLRSLAAAARQLVFDFPGQKITADLVGRYFGGRAEAKSFAVADHAFNGQRERALEELRWALDGGTAAVLVTSAFAGSARGLARYRSARRGMSEADLARDVGVPPWKLRTLRTQAQHWDDAGLARAIRAVAAADADVKGAATDPAYALERLVLTIAALRV